MSKQLLATSLTKSTIQELVSARKRHDTFLFIILFVTLFSLTPLLTLWGATIGFSVIIGGLIALVLAASLLRWPVVGLYLVSASAFLVEQEPLATPIGTDRLYIFFWPPQLQGFIERPIGLLIFAALFLWLFHRLTQRQPLLKGGALLFPFLLYLLCVIGGAVYGMASGGNFKIIVLELRPFWYMFISYILAYNFITRKSHVRDFFWLVIISAAFKGIQGLYIYLILFHGDLSGHDTIMSHEESFFFAALLLLVIIFCLYHRYRPQLIVALCIAPVVLIAMVANQRRTDYIALLVGVGIAWVLVFQLKPKARTLLLISMLMSVALGTGYVLAFSHSSGSFAEPARAVISVFRPDTSDTRDVTSNLYRIFENNDLKFTVKQYPLGVGLGKPFLQPEPLTQIFPTIVNFAPYYNYIPHNTIYWIWTDLGYAGYFSLWLLIGSIIVRGCIIARSLKDPYLQVVAIYIVAVAAMEVVVAFADYQLFFYRNVIYLGLLCGILVKLPMLEHQEQKEVPIHESTDGISTPSRSLVGSKHS